MVRHVRGQGELALFTEAPADAMEASSAADLLALVMDNNLTEVAHQLRMVSATDRYRLRVACRILILEAAKQERIHPS